MRFKNDKTNGRIRKEWESGKLDKRVEIMAIYLDWYCRNFVRRIDGQKGDIQLTCIFRTQKEQEAIYGKGTKKKSTHQYWRAVDIGVNAFSFTTREMLANMMNKRFKNIGKAKCCVWHNVGLGDHFHLQVGGGKYSKMMRI